MSFMTAAGADWHHREAGMWAIHAVARVFVAGNGSELQQPLLQCGSISNLKNHARVLPVGEMQHMPSRQN